MTQQGGSVPRWPLAHGYTGCMIGNHAGQVVPTPPNKGLCILPEEIFGPNCP